MKSVSLFSFYAIELKQLKTCLYLVLAICYRMVYEIERERKFYSAEGLFSKLSHNLLWKWVGAMRHAGMGGVNCGLTYMVWCRCDLTART